MEGHKRLARLLSGNLFAVFLCFKASIVKELRVFHVILSDVNYLRIPVNINFEYRQ